MNFFITYKNTIEQPVFLLHTEDEIFIPKEQIAILYNINKNKLEEHISNTEFYMFYNKIYYKLSEVYAIGESMCSQSSFNEIKNLKLFIATVKDDILQKIYESKCYETPEGKFYLIKDDHGKKHMQLNYDDAMKKGSPATFNTKFKQCYESTLKKSIIACANAIDEKSKLITIVDFNEEVGIDEQKKVQHVELYYDGEIGSHIRPKLMKKNDECITLGDKPILLSPMNELEKIM